MGYGSRKTADRRAGVDKLRACMEDYLRQRGLPLRKAFRCLSPAHEDKHPSMSYNQRANNVHCFSCGVTYDLFDLIGMDYGLGGFAEQYEKACGLFGITAPTLAYCEEKPEIPVASAYPRRELPETWDRSGELESIRLKSDGGTGYFEIRGITGESCDKYGLFQQGGRAYFPVMEGGCCVGWSARAIQDGVQPRYKNTAGAMGIWNGDYLKQNGGGARLFVTEGIIDAICLEQSGEKAIALCGSQNAEKLLRRCERYPRTAGSWSFIACGDPDDAGGKMNAALSGGLKKLGIKCLALPLTENDGDVGQLYLQDRERLLKIITEAAEDNSESEKYPLESAADGLADFFREARRRAELGAVPTGFAELDGLLDGGLYPGLYVLGAISSIGKTSFALQIADYIAENAADVLFFSLEQSRFELMAKSLSRTSAQLDGAERRNSFTARQLLSGNIPDTPRRLALLEEAAEIYARAASGLYIIEGVADVGVGEIRRIVSGHQARRGAAPVVIVDYLQILKPADPRATDKQNTDRAVVELKRISRDFDIPVIAISSFNRENYRAAVSMEAFKESGAVEYSSDVLLGLQLAGAGEKNFDVNRAKSREPRKLELVMLKNRSGVPYAKLPIDYCAKFSLFSAVSPAGSRIADKPPLGKIPAL